MKLSEAQWEELLNLDNVKQAHKLLDLPTNRYGLKAEHGGIDIMADELAQAQANRQRVCTHYCEDYYNHLDEVIEGWELGELPPADLPIDNYTYNPVIFQKSIMSLDND